MLANNTRRKKSPWKMSANAKQEEWKKCSVIEPISLGADDNFHRSSTTANQKTSFRIVDIKNISYWFATTKCSFATCIDFLGVDFDTNAKRLIWAARGRENGETRNMCRRVFLLTVPPAYAVNPTIVICFGPLPRLGVFHHFSHACFLTNISRLCSHFGFSN